MKKEPLDIGALRIVSGSVLITDPHQQDGSQTNGPVQIEQVAKGRWLILVTYIEEGPKQGQLETFTALHMKHVERELEWDFHPQPIETKSGFLGLFDKERHKAVETPFHWSLFPHAFVHKTQTGSGFFDFSLAKLNSQVVGFEVFLNKLDELMY
jgi:hypothetical protein